MKRFLFTTTAAMLVATATIAAGPKDFGPGRMTIDTPASEWSSDTAADPGAGIYPVGGSGQLNGEFVTAERNGIQLGLRATDRTDGLLDVSGKKVGEYTAATGFDGSTTNRAEWNYDVHLDLRDARGVARGTTLADYTLTMTHDIAADMDNPFDLTFGVPQLDNAVLLQHSFNPMFFNSTFDPTVEDTYRLSVTLTPVTFHGPPLTATILVHVED